MEKDRVVKKDVSQNEVVEYFQPLRTGFALIFINLLTPTVATWVQL